MNAESIQKVAQCISPIRFNLRDVDLVVDDDFDPDLNSEYSYKLFIRFGVSQHKIVTSSDGEERLLRWYGKASVKLSPDDEDEADEDNGCKISIDVGFVQTYRIRPGCEIPDGADLKEFGVHNVQYHTWPYLRELMQSYGEKLGIGPIPLPHYIVPKSQE